MKESVCQQCNRVRSVYLTMHGFSIMCPCIRAEQWRQAIVEWSRMWLADCDPGDEDRS